MPAPAQMSSTPAVKRHPGSTRIASPKMLRITSLSLPGQRHRTKSVACTAGQHARANPDVRMLPMGKSAAQRSQRLQAL